MTSPDTDARLPWEAPAVTDIDLTSNTLSGTASFTSESSFTNDRPDPLS